MGAGSTAQFLADGNGRTRFVNNNGDFGGAVFVDGGAFAATSADFTGNTVTRPDGDGGAVFNIGGGVALFDTTFTNNAALSDGGAIYSQDGVLEVQRSAFVGNRAAGGPVAGGTGTGDLSEGGAVFVNRGVFVTGNTTFDDNFADENGGAVATLDATVAGFGNVFVDNAARGDGGAVAATGGTFTAEDFAFGDGVNPGNAAGRSGGGLAVRNGIALLRRNLFLGNAAAADGGGLASLDNRGGFNAPQSRLEVVDSTFADNGSLGLGGAVSLNNALATFTRDTAVRNVSLDGGAIAVLGGRTVLVDTVLDRNSAEFRGGGLFTAAGAVVASQSSVYVNNGGGGDLRPTLARLRSEGLATPSNAALGAAGVNVASVVTDVGGGIYHAGSILTLRGGRVAGNFAFAFPNLFVASGSAFNPIGVAFV